MATPLLRAARQALPHAKVIGIMRPGLDDVLRGTTWLDEMIVCDNRGAFGPLRLSRAIRRLGTQAALLLPNSFGSALGARCSGAAVRIGYNRDARGWLLTHKKPDSKTVAPVAMVAYYADLAKFAFGLAAIDRRIELAVTDQENRAADELLRDVKRRFVLVNPGASRADKRWPADRFAAVADRLASSHGLTIVTSGSPSEWKVLDAIRQAAKSPIINIAECGVTLGSLKAVIQHARLMITNDTGPRHIAAALGTPVVTLFGPTDHRWTTLDCPHERILLAEPFLPDELVADRHANACAIDKISVGDVAAAAEQLLREFPQTC